VEEEREKCKEKSNKVRALQVQLKEESNKARALKAQLTEVQGSGGV
jgi:predicted RNase H-like nuclease (RuvC/YqgF family)